MLWIIVVIVFMLYVMYSISTIKYQLKMIAAHLGIEEKDKKIATISDEEIEKELENELLK